MTVTVYEKIYFSSEDEFNEAIKHIPSMHRFSLTALEEKNVIDYAEAEPNLINKNGEMIEKCRLYILRDSKQIKPFAWRYITK